MFFPAWRFIWELERGVKNTCKLSWWSTHLFPQSVQRGKYCISGHLIGLKVTSLEFSNMESMLANLESNWNLLEQPSSTSVFSNTSFLTLASIFYCPSVPRLFPKLRFPTKKWLFLGINLSSRSVLQSFFNQPTPSIKTYPSHSPFPLDCSQTSPIWWTINSFFPQH